jgi:RNA polymerase sigma factor (sigma-70 family)
MAKIRTGTVAEELQTVFGVGSLGGVSDGDLLRRFIARGDQAAFAAILARHGRMVLSVCRATLGRLHDAEDAFQATFLVLARRPGSIRDPELLGPWLHGVARRTAHKARVAAARRRSHEEAKAALEGDRVEDMASRPFGRDEEAALHEEIGRLPEHYRLAVVLCDLQGHSHAEAARRLRRPVGTVSARISRARQILRARLARRGLVPAGLLAGLAMGESAWAAPSPTQVDAALTGVTQTPRPTVATLARGVIRTMDLTRIAIGALALSGALGLLALTYAAASPALPRAPSPPEDPPPAASVKSDATRQLDTAAITVPGRAMDAEGKPVAGAVIVLRSTNGIDAALGQTTTDREGRFAFRNVRLPVRRPREDADLLGTFQVYGTATGYGFAWHGMRSYSPTPRPADIPATAGKPMSYAGEDLTTDLTFRTPVALRGRIVDADDRPVAEVEVELRSADYLDLQGRQPHKNFREFWCMDQLPLQCRAARTDSDGRFRIDGLPQGTFYWLGTRHPDYAGLTMFASTDAETVSLPIYPGNNSHEVAANPLELTLSATRRLVARIVYATSGKPARGTRVGANSLNRKEVGAFGVAGADGTIVLKLPPDEYRLTLDPPRDTTFVRTETDVVVPRGADDLPMTLKVVPGCVLEIEVVDAETGTGIRGVSLAQSEEPGVPGTGREIQSSTWLIDNPATDRNGRLRAVVYPGHRAIRVSRVLKGSGYGTDTPPQAVDLPAAETVKLRFALRKGGN